MGNSVTNQQQRVYFLIIEIDQLEIQRRQLCLVLHLY
jgi:hypothetical protein